MAKLWLLEITESAGWYDVFDAFVIRADTEAKARLLASQQPADQERPRHIPPSWEDLWLNPKRSSCTELSPNGVDAVLGKHFYAG